MKIPEAIKEKRELLRSEGDPIKIAERAELHPETIRLVFRRWECSDDVFGAIAEYYEEKMQTISQYL